MITNKKGIALSQAFGAVLVVVLIAVLVIIGIFLFDVLGDTFTNEAQSVVNESITPLVESNVTLAGAAACNFQSDVSASLVSNVTDGSTILAANYTIAADGNMILDTANFNNTEVLVTYTYTDGGNACVASDAMITQFANYPALIGLVGTIIFLGLVIGILVVSFVFGGKRDQP